MDLWIFGYGSLMWRPGFAFEQVTRARLQGYRRCFCIYSVHHRGTEARPGLVLGLDRGGSCEGIAYRVGAKDVTQVLAYLREREQVNGVYREARVPIDIIAPKVIKQGCSARAGFQGNNNDAKKDHVVALTYLVERAHPSYAARLSLAIQARLIRGARGKSGNNMEYLANTLAHLRSLGIIERDLERLGVLVGHGIHRERDGQCVECPRLRGMTHAAARHPVRLVKLKPGERRRFVYRKSLGKGMVRPK